MPRHAARRALICAALLGLAAACTPIVDNHGYAPDEASLAEVQAGFDSRDTVMRKVGRPGLSGVIRQDGWYYVASTVQTEGWSRPEEIDRRVVAIRFGEDGLVSSVERYGMEDGRVINLVTRTTPTYGREMTVLQQLFGNIGNLSASDAPSGFLGQ